MEICYLIAFPDIDDGIVPAKETFKGLKDAPYFQPVDIDLVTLGEETVVIEGYAVSAARQRYDGRVQMIECRFGLRPVCFLRLAGACKNSICAAEPLRP